MYRPPTKEEIRALIRVAQGEEKGDLAIINGTLLNVYSGELQPHQGVVTKGAWVAYVGQEPNPAIGSHTQVIDASGCYLLPGFIDGHTHMGMISRLSDCVRLAAPRGTTTIITEAMEIGNSLGLAGIQGLMEDMRHQPIKLFISAPCMVPPFPDVETSRGMTEADFDLLMQQPDILSLGEAYWPRVVAADEEVISKLAKALNWGKVLEGHSAGARGHKLAAYVAAGITSDHEAITKEEALERLRLGLYVMIRDGDIRHDLDAIFPIKDEPIDFRRLLLVTDGVFPVNLIRQGYLDAAVRKAIRLGFDPIRAVQMVTLNVADHFGLRYLGGIAPGRIADLLIVQDLQELHCHYVLSDGRVIAKEGELLEAPPRPAYPKDFYRAVSLPPVTAEAFRLERVTAPARGRVVHIVNNMITQEVIAELKTIDHQVVADPERDILKMAVFNRHATPLRHTLGFLSGFGIRRGAVASSIIWDTYNILAIGTNDADMAAVVNHLSKIGGGLAFVIDGQPVAEIALTIGGLIADTPVEKLAAEIEEFTRQLQEAGCKVESPFLNLQTLCFTGLPYLRLTDKGLFDVRQRRLVAVLLD